MTETKQEPGKVTLITDSKGEAIVRVIEKYLKMDPEGKSYAIGWMDGYEKGKETIR